jgi:hypothetical protein
MKAVVVAYIRTTGTIWVELYRDLRTRREALFYGEWIVGEGTVVLTLSNASTP